MALSLGALLLALGLCGLTGSSYGAAAAGDLLLGSDRATRREVWGVARGIRSDEYGVELPFSRAQQLARPSFPLVHTRLGLGHMQRAPFEVPVLDWGLAFRPVSWPLLLGGTSSQGVRWFARSAVLFLGLFAWLRVLTDRFGPGVEDRRHREWLVLGGALTLFLTSALTWWLSAIVSPVIAFAGVCAWAGRAAITGRTLATRLGWLAGTAWLSAVTFFYFYPPLWAPILWLLSATFLDVGWRMERRPLRTIVRALPVLAAVAIGVMLSIVYFAPYLALVADTLYPGRRIAHAGEMPLDRLATLLWPSLEVKAPARGWEAYRGKIAWMNQCEASAVEVLPALLVVALACVAGPVRDALRRLVARIPFFLAAMVVLAAWLLAPLPAWVGVPTLLRWSPWPRTWLAFALGCGFLGVAALVEIEPATSDGQARRSMHRDLLLAGAVLAVSWLVARPQLVVVDPRLRLHALLWAAGALVGVAALRTRARATVLLAAWLASLAVADYAVNPLLSSRDLFRKGPGHAVVDDALRRVPGRLLDYTASTGSILAGFGWPILAGVAMAPDLGLSRFLAPESPGYTEFVYNRYAHIHFVLPPSPTRFIRGDLYEVSLSPCSRRLAALGVNHVLVRAGTSVPGACADEFEARRAGDAELWTRRRPVALAGVARGEAPRSALDFDYGADAVGLPEVVPGRGELLVNLPPGGRTIALAVNRSVIEDVQCDGARPAFVDAHLIVTPSGSGSARCRLVFLGSAGALRRLVLHEQPVAERLQLGL